MLKNSYNAIYFMKMPFRKPKQPKKPRAETHEKWKKRGIDKGPEKRSLLKRLKRSNRFGKIFEQPLVEGLHFSHGVTVPPEDPEYGELVRFLKVRNGDKIAVSRSTEIRQGQQELRPIIIKVSSAAGKGERYFTLKVHRDDPLFDRLLRKYLPPWVDSYPSPMD